MNESEQGQRWTLRRWNDPHAGECSEWEVGEWPEHLRGDTRNEQVEVVEVDLPHSRQPVTPEGE